MKGFTEIESEAKLLRSIAKRKKLDSELLATFDKGLEKSAQQPVEISSLEDLAQAFKMRLKTTHASADWKQLWRDSAKAAARVLGDCFGIRGGALRRMHKLPAAITAYDQGFAYEGEKEFAIPDSYNRVQRLVVRIIDNKNELREPNDLEMIVVPEQKTVLDALRQKSTVFEQLREAKEA